MDNIVYHYCSTDVFTKIVSGKSIRLSDITKSNDSMEIRWITKYIKEVFLEEFDKEAVKTTYFNDDYPKGIFIDLLDEYIEEFFNTDQRLYSYLVCCFSEIGDLLSQWRGYADDAAGFSIGFDTDVINNHRHLYSYDKVIYAERNQKALVRKEAKTLITRLKSILNDEKGSVLINSMPAFRKCFFQLFKTSILLKNPFFEEEKEWRISLWISTLSETDSIKVTSDNELSFSELDYYSRKNDVIPYIDLSFKKFKGSIIKDVVIGPKNRASQRDIEDYLKNNGIVCSVRKSAGTYR